MQQVPSEVITQGSHILIHTLTHLDSTWPFGSFPGCIPGCAPIDPGVNELREPLLVFNSLENSHTQLVCAQLGLR